MTAPDEDYLTEHAMTEQSAAVRAGYEDRCTAGCRHHWHGLACQTCGCPSSYQPQP